MRWGIWERHAMVARMTNVSTSGSSNFRLLLPRPPSDHLDEWYSVLSEFDWDGLEADVYLALIGADRLQLSGFLVTAKSNINAVIAHCPVKNSYQDLHEQLLVAQRIAQNPQI